MALRTMTAPRARVLRDGRQMVVAAADVVPRDILLLEAGDVVAADARVIEAHALVDERGPADGRERAGREGPRADAGRTRRWPSVTTSSSWAPRSRRGPGWPR